VKRSLPTRELIDVREKLLKKMKGSIAILVVVVVVAFLAGWSQAAEESDDPRLQFLHSLNQWRMSANLREVFINEDLMDFAQRRVDEMVSKSKVTLEYATLTSEVKYDSIKRTIRAHMGAQLTCTNTQFGERQERA
jgi:hypothetical protein